jgi:hypothetical protein
VITSQKHNRSEQKAIQLMNLGGEKKIIYFSKQDEDKGLKWVNLGTK